MELWVTGDRSALSLEATANYFRENLFRRASLSWLGRKDQIYSPRLSHLASFTFLSLLLPGFCFFCFPPRPIVLVLFQWLRHNWSQEQAEGSFGVLGWGGLPIPSPSCSSVPSPWWLRAAPTSAIIHIFCWVHRVRYSKLLSLYSTSATPHLLHC